MGRLAVVLLAVACGASSPAWAGGTWYNFYENGQNLMKKGDYDRALMAFQAAASLEFKENKQARTYGMNFIEYFPHREMGVCYYFIGEMSNARRELELSLAFVKSARAQEYLGKIAGGVPPTPAVNKQEQAKLDAEKKRLADEQERLSKQRDELAKLEAQKREEEEERLKEQEERLAQERQKHERGLAALLSRGQEKLPEGALTYDPSRVTAVGERMSIAVLPFQTRGGSVDLGEIVLDKLITQLVALHRFKIIERSQLEKVLKEQALGLSGVVDASSAAQLGRVLGVDAVLIGSITSDEKKVGIDGRLVNTETAEIVTSADAYTKSDDPEEIRKLAAKIAIGVYNAMPLVEGTIIKADAPEYAVDLGADKGMKKGMKVVAFKVGEEIKHPLTGEVLGRKPTKLGELVLRDVQARFATAEVLEKDGSIGVGDKVVVK